MRCVVLLASLLVIPACGGGGGGGSTPPATEPIRLSAAAVEFGPATTTAELTVSLDSIGAVAPALAKVDIELPAGVVLAAEPLVAAQPLLAWTGAMVDGRYRVVCGDDRNANAVLLQPGPLFRLRLTTAVPRQAGSFTITLRGLQVARANGDDATTDPNPTTVSVTVR